MSKHRLYDRARGINSKQLALAVAFLLAVKLILLSTQMIHIFPGGNAPIDDELMFYAAQSIGRGNWLGDYNCMTIAKHMFFSVWLWFTNLLHIPYLVAGQLLYFSACLVAMKAVSPTLKNRLRELLFFAVLWLSPYSEAYFTLRVYRDNIFPSLCLMFFAGLTGIALRYNEKPRSSVPYAIFAGIGFGLSWLTREDGIWLVPFYVCAGAVYIIFICRSADRRNGFKRALSGAGILGVSVAVSLSLIFSYCAMNYRYYGRFIVSDYSSREFQNAISVMSSADTDGPHAGVLICKNTRAKLKQVSPLAKRLFDELDKPEYLNGYESVATGDFNNSIFWQIRRAAQNIGLASDAVSAEKFYISIADEITAAFESGALQKSGVASLNPMMVPYDDSFVVPTLKEALSSFCVLFGFEQTSTLAPLSYSTQEQAAEWENYTRERSSRVAVYNTAEPLYSRWQKGFELCATVIRYVYIALCLPCFLIGLVRIGKRFGLAVKRFVKKETDAEGMGSVMALGFFLSALLRVVAVSYVNASGMLLPTYLLYISSAGPLILLVAAYGAGAVLDRVDSAMLSVNTNK